MKLEQSFTVAAAPDVVWAALIDVQRVAPCLPGAQITQDAGDGSYKGEFTVRLGPTKAVYSGALKLLEVDEANRVVTMDAKGTDKRGQGGTTASIISSVHADVDGGGARVDVHTDFAITGKLARFGRGGMIQDVSNKLLREFAANLQEELGGGGAADAAPAPTAASGAPSGSAGAAAPPPPRAPRAAAEPIDGFNLAGGVVFDRVKAGLPMLLVGVIIGMLLGRR